MSLTIDDLCERSPYRRRTSHATPARCDHTGVSSLCATPFAPGLAPGPGLVRRCGADARSPHRDRRLAGHGVRPRASRFTNYHRVLNRATWSARQGSRIRLGLLLTVFVPPGATIVLGADDTVERRSGCQIKAKGCDRDAVRSTKKHVIRCYGLKWVSMMLLVPVPWSQRVWALPFLTALCWPAKKRGPQRHKTSVDWVRQMMQQVRRWLPGRRLVLVVDGGFAAVSLALACVTHHVTMVSRLRWDAALYHEPELQPPGKRGPKPTKGKRQRSLQGWAERSDTPWEAVEVEWNGTGGSSKSSGSSRA